MSSREELLKMYLHLSHLNVIGRMRHDSLVESFGSIKNALTASHQELCQCHYISSTIADKILSPMDHTALEMELHLWEKNHITIHLITDEDYPTNLKQNSDAPIMLQIKGEYVHEDHLAIAIVGSRNCSSYGSEQAYYFSKALAEKGFTIVSGMARGIDSAAHRGALDAGQRTLAVQACGLNSIYPPSGKKLAEIIINNGALISEMPWNMPALRQNFPRRNRIVSGLSIGTVVIEAAKKSGSLITARWAMEQNREVFALPGNINNPLSYGCHKLIQDGAKLVMNVDDILDEFPALTLSTSKPDVKKVNHPPLNDKQKKIMRLFNKQQGIEELSFNSLQQSSALNPSELSLTLFKLESMNILKALPQKKYRMIGANLVDVLK